MKAYLAAILLAVAVLSGCTAPGTAPVRAIRQPVLVPVQRHGEERYQNAKDWTWTQSGAAETVPAGLLVDGASVPRAVWWFMPPDGLHRAAALAHDWSYIKRGRLNNGITLTREQADLCFYNMMLEAGLGRMKAGTAYRAVRSFGWVEWQRPYVGPVIEPVDPAYMLRPKRKAFSRHLYEVR